MNNIIKNKNFIKHTGRRPVWGQVKKSRLNLSPRDGVRWLLILNFILILPATHAQEINEVFQETHTEVLVREHPQTGESYVTIISDKEPVPKDPLGGRNKYSRPDYRMLDPKYKSKDIPYDGPYSSKKKIYILAASLATVGAGGAVIGATVFPAAASTVATGSAIGPAVGAVATGVGAVALAKKFEGKDLPDDYARIQESRLLETENDFYQLHIKPRTN